MKPEGDVGSEGSRVLARCGACGALNRAPADRIARGEKPTCGKCGAPIEIERGVIEVSDATYEREVARWPGIVVLDLWAPWCGPCRMLAPVLEELAGEFAGRVRFAKLNVDEHPATAARFEVRGIPLLVVMNAGREVDRLTGLQPKHVIAQRLSAHLSGQS